MVSVKGSFSSSTPQIRAPQYHDIVSRMLQKQFVHACVWSLILSYVASFIFGANHGLWYLFPWSWTGIRSIGMFAAIFPVYILRKANLHGMEGHSSWWGFATNNCQWPLLLALLCLAPSQLGQYLLMVFEPFLHMFCRQGCSRAFGSTIVPRGMHSLSS